MLLLGPLLEWAVSRTVTGKTFLCRVQDKILISSTPHHSTIMVCHVTLFVMMLASSPRCVAPSMLRQGRYPAVVNARETPANISAPYASQHSPECSDNFQHGRGDEVSQRPPQHACQCRRRPPQRCHLHHPSHSCRDALFLQRVLNITSPKLRLLCLSPQTHRKCRVYSRGVRDCSFALVDTSDCM